MSGERRREAPKEQDAKERIETESGAEARNAHWCIEDFFGPKLRIRCSVCGSGYDVAADVFKTDYRYCPFCGVPQRKKGNG